MPATGQQTYSMDFGRPNVSLDGVTYGVTQGDIGHAYAVPMGPRHVTTPAFTWQTVITGAPATCQVDIQGTLDQNPATANWFQIDTNTATTSYIQHIANKPVSHIRAKLVALTGGTSPTVTVTIQA